MKVKFWDKKKSKLDDSIDLVLEEMAEVGPDLKEFERDLGYLERLQELKARERRQFRVSPDTALMVLGNLAGILIIVAYEQKHVMTSKGFGFIKPNNTASGRQ